LILLTLLIAACANHEGLYEPACVAYEGDRIQLKGGRFEWQRFTDERAVDEAGKGANPFPGFPRLGTYRAKAGRLTLVTDEDVRLDDWFVVVHAQQHYLLTTGQHDAFLESGELPECVLRLAGNGY
jgi:hypothetical protein